MRAHAYRAPSLPQLALPASGQLSLLQHTEKITGDKSKSGIKQFFRSKISHKHSQSLDSSNPYISITECHSGVRSSQHPAPPPSAAALSGARLPLTSIVNEIRNVPVHVRSSSQLVISPSKQNIIQQLDVPCNRQFKMYPKCASNSSLASFNSCATTTTTANSVSASYHTSSRISLQEAVNQLNTGHERSLSITSSTSSASNIYSNCAQIAYQLTSQPPPRPPKPVSFRSESTTPAQSEDESSISVAPGWLRLPQSTCPSASTVITPFGNTGCYAQLHGFQSSYGVNIGHQRPKNSISSSCSSNPSPPSSGREGKDDHIFQFDTLNSQEQSDNSQPSSPFDNLIPNLRPPNINRALKPRKTSDYNLYSSTSPFNLQSPQQAFRGRNYSTESASEDDTVILGDFPLRPFAYTSVGWEQSPPLHPAPLPPQEDEIQYLDLDLKKEDDNSVDTKERKISRFESVNSLTPSIRDSHTVYKTVDFVKTNIVCKLRKERDLQHCYTSEN